MSPQGGDPEKFKECGAAVETLTDDRLAHVNCIGLEPEIMYEEASRLRLNIDPSPFQRWIGKWCPRSCFHAFRALQ